MGSLHRRGANLQKFSERQRRGEERRGEEKRRPEAAPLYKRERWIIVLNYGASKEIFRKKVNVVRQVKAPFSCWRRGGLTVI